MAIFDILKTDDFEEFNEERGLKASILKGIVQITTRDVLNKSQFPGYPQTHILFSFLSLNRQTVPSGYCVAQSASYLHDYEACL